MNKTAIPSPVECCATDEGDNDKMAYRKSCKNCGTIKVDDNDDDEANYQLFVCCCHHDNLKQAKDHVSTNIDIDDILRIQTANIKSFVDNYEDTVQFAPVPSAAQLRSVHIKVFTEGMFDHLSLICSVSSTINSGEPDICGNDIVTLRLSQCYCYD